MNTLERHLPPTTTRVEENTSGELNLRIERKTEEVVLRVACEGRDAIARRLDELDREWDIERTLEANAAIVSLITLALGYFMNPWWYAFTAVVVVFLLQHAVQGWCPPVPIFRRRGIRTERVINMERTALRILRGDFRSTADPREALAQARAGHSENISQ